MLFDMSDLNEEQMAFLMAIRDIGMSICVNSFEASDLDVLADFKQYMNEQSSMEFVALIELCKDKAPTPDDLLLTFAPFIKSIELDLGMDNFFKNLKNRLIDIQSEEELREYCYDLMAFSKTDEISEYRIDEKEKELGAILESINEFDLIDVLHYALLEYTGTVEEDDKIDEIIITLCACLSKYEV